MLKPIVPGQSNEVYFRLQLPAPPLPPIPPIQIICSGCGRESHLCICRRDALMMLAVAVFIAIAVPVVFYLKG